MNIIRFRKALLCLVLMQIAIIGYASNKVALIVGNGNYLDTKFENLPTCINDANAIDSVLSNLGFLTMVIADANKDEMLDAFDRFARMAKGADVAVYYFSGHATNIGGELFLVPSKSYFRNTSLSDQLVRVANIREIMENSSKLSLLFFDACRDGATTGAVQNKSRKKVSRVNPNREASGCMLFYATQNGKTATVGNGNLSPFTQVLIEHLNDGDEFRDVWQNIKAEVPGIAPGQYPSSESVYGGDFHFYDKGEKTAAPMTINDVTKKTITISSNISRGKIDFYGTKYDFGTPLLFNIGKKYTYTINVDGYLPYTGILDVKESTPDHIYVTLEKVQVATLKLNCNRDANVYFDGSFVGLYRKGKEFIIDSYSSKHTLKLTADNCSPYQAEFDLNPGVNVKFASIRKNTPPFWDWDGDYEGSQYLSYNFSPKYQIGLSYLYRPEDSRFSYGLYLSGSTGLFRGIDGISAYSYAFAGTDITYTIDVDGTVVKYQETSSLVSDKPIDKYSEDIDPNHEAKKYDANALILANFGFNPCNGLLIEAGVGAGFHQDKYYLPYTSYMTQTITKNLTTGEIVGEPKYDYIKGGGYKWFKQNSKWSPALRLGAKAMIPLDSWNEYFLTLGGGYTFQFMNMKYSSWDATVGIAWTF